MVSRPKQLEYDKAQLAKELDAIKLIDPKLSECWNGAGKKRQLKLLKDFYKSSHCPKEYQEYFSDVYIGLNTVNPRLTGTANGAQAVPSGYR
ncbi:MAG: hypothetical protein OEY79_04700 [Anaplasmataceae bacterium]|nr:hypothetical protein [Anaplasmataceae bacterium]